MTASDQLPAATDETTFRVVFQVATQRRDSGFHCCGRDVQSRRGGVCPRALKSLSSCRLPRHGRLETTYVPGPARFVLR